MVLSKRDTPMESPRFSAEKLIDYIQRCQSAQSPVTVNLGIFQDGSIGPESAALMSSVREKIRG
jgi:hypothetical protein